MSIYHSQKSKGISKGGRSRSSSPSPKHDIDHCWAWIRGSCSDSKCKFKHDPHAAPKSAPAEPKGKAKPKEGNAKATPALMKLAALEDTDDEPFSDSDVTWGNNGDPRCNKIHRKVSFRTSSTVHKFKCDSMSRSSKPASSQGKPRTVFADHFVSEQHIMEVLVGGIRARAKALILEQELEDGCAPMATIHIGPVHAMRLRMTDGDGIDFVEEIVEHMTVKKDHNGVHFAISRKKKSTKFIMDTGCGHDLISQDKVDKMRFEKYPLLHSQRCRDFHKRPHGSSSQSLEWHALRMS